MYQQYKIHLIHLVCMLLSFLLFLLGLSSMGMASEQQNLATIRITPSADTYVLSGNPASTTPKDWHVFWVGHNQSPTIQTEHALVKFDLANLPVTATVQSAILSAYLQKAVPSNDLPIQIRIHRVKGDWSETIAWQDYLKLSSIDTPNQSISVGTTPDWQTWDVKEIIEHWRQDSNRDAYLSLVLRSNAETGNRERTFLSKDCPVSSCNDRQPKLEIQYILPLPPVSTPTPTATTTPTPGIKAIWLQNAPQEELAGGAIVTYTIDLENGPYSLAKVVVRNPLPDEVEFVRESAIAPPGWAFSLTERIIQWTRPTLDAGERSRLVYRAQRHTPTSTPTLIETEPKTPTATPTVTSTPPSATPILTQTALPQIVTPTPMLPALATSMTITKTGPNEAAIGSEIRYLLTVANHVTRTLTGLTIVDLIPVGAEVVDFGGGALTMPPSAMLQWQVPRLNAQSVVTRTFAIRPSSNQSQVINQLYFVDVIENGVLRLRVVGKEAVVTTIVGGGLESLSAPLSLPTTPLTATSIINDGALVNWEYLGFNGQLISNPVYNPMHYIYLPFLPR